jgi:predicted nucleic acid-binding protein
VILVDTSVWIGHLRSAVPDLVRLLDSALVAQHPMVIGELALGTLRDRRTFLELLGNLPRAPVATHDEVLSFVEHRRLFGRGLGLVDAHLLASATVGHGTRLWTRDESLRVAARELGVLLDAD